jgi:hypothetical protein
MMNRRYSVGLMLGSAALHYTAVSRAARVSEFVGMVSKLGTSKQPLVDQLAKNREQLST